MAKKTPLISVVMPVYNSEKYVAEAIESVLNQTFKDFEFIIIDDGSTDKSLEIIKRYAKKDKRIKLVVNESNLKICKTLNKGIKLAKGKYIVRMDSDDISLPTRFEEQVNFMENHPEVGVVGSWIQIINEQNIELSIRKYPEIDSELRKKIFFYSPFAHPAVMIRKEVFNKVGLFNDKYPNSQDLDLWFRIGESFKFANLQKILLRYRLYSESATGSKLKRMELIANKIRWKNWNNSAYSFGIKAFFYNLFHLISIYIIPSKFKLWLFSKLRDNKK